MSSLGERVRAGRQALGLTQAELASRLGKSVAWVSQVERGTREVNRLPVLESLADVLDIDVSPLAEPNSSFNSLLGATSVLLLDGMTSGAKISSIGRESVDDIWRLIHSGDIVKSEQLVTTVLEQVGAAVVASSSSVDHANTSYLWSAISAHLAQTGEKEASWMAAEQSAVFAALAGESLGVAAAVFRLVIALQKTSRLELANTVCGSATQSLKRVEQCPERDALLGAFSLQAAVVEAKLGNADEAYSSLRDAKKYAKNIGASSEYFDLEFGLANVAVHEVFIAHSLGDSGRACRVGQALLDDTVQYGSLSAERQYRLNNDLAVAFNATGDTAQANVCRDRSKSIAPQLLLVANQLDTDQI